MNKDYRFDNSANSADDAIERALAGLRKVEAPAGLEDRVLQAMHNRTAAAEEHVDTGRLSAWVRWAGFGLAAAAALLMISVALHEHNGSKGERQTANLSPVRGPEPLARTEASVDPSNEAASVRPARPQVLRVERELRPKRLVSFPAPEPPLTEEEKLLQKIARSGDQQQFAMLDAQTRARDEAAREAAFEEFEKDGQ